MPANQLTFRHYTWNLTRLLAHEMTHCYQFHHLGWWRTNPLANYPTWKREGYAEYVARQPAGPTALRENVAYLQQAERRAPGQWGLRLPDSTSTSREYFRYLMLNEYCLDVKHLTFEQAFRDTTTQHTTYQQLLTWYESEEAASKRR